MPDFLDSDALTDEDLVTVGRILTVAVRDTVGAMGFPEFSSDRRRVDAF